MKNEELIESIIRKKGHSMSPSEISMAIVIRTFLHPREGRFVSPYKVWKTVHQFPDKFSIEDGRVSLAK